MAAPTSEADLILQKANIADVIGRYIEVQKKGNSYVAVCPFHDDSSPSLNISVEKKIFKCFACGAGGNSLTFVQRFKSISFPEALAEVGRMVGVDVRINQNIKPKYSTIQEKVIAINEDALNYFATMLFTKDGKAARDYLAERKISLKEIRKYNIGYAKHKYNLYNFLKEKRNYTVKEIEESALFRKNGLTYLPIFFNRLLFPIRDLDGRVIGFSGRIISKEKDIPKYVNTSENVIFKKSHLAYNFHNAESAIRIKDEIIILEGYMDVISLNRINVNNAVAIMGTSLSDFHVKEFKRLTSNFTIFLDGDDAGINATFKLIKQLKNQDINVKVVFNQTKMDPDELIKAGEKTQVIKMIEEAKLPSEFTLEVIRERMKVDDSLEAKDNALKLLFEVLQNDSQVHISDSLKKVSAIIAIDFDSIKAEFEKYKPQVYHQKQSEQKVVEPKKVPQRPTPIINNELEAMADMFADALAINDGFVDLDSYNVSEPIEPEPITKNIYQPDILSNKEEEGYYSAILVLVESWLTNLDPAIKNYGIRSSFPARFVELANKIVEIKNQNKDFSKNEIIEVLGKKFSKEHREYFKLKNDLHFFDLALERGISQQMQLDALLRIEKRRKEKEVANLDELLHDGAVQYTELEKKEAVAPEDKKNELKKQADEKLDSISNVYDFRDKFTKTIKKSNRGK